MKIERSTGEYILGSQKLGRDLNEPEFLRSALGLAAKKIPAAGARKYYEIWQPVGKFVMIDYARPSQHSKTVEQ